MRRYIFVITLLAVLACSGCRTVGGNASASHVADGYSQWHALLDNYGRCYEEKQGKTGMHYQIVTGVAWPIGSLIEGNFGGKRRSCTIAEASAPIAVQDGPLITFRSQQGFGASLPEALALPASVKTDLSRSVTCTFQMFDMQLEVVDTDYIKALIIDNSCGISPEELRDNPHRLVYGIVSGRQRICYTQTASDALGADFAKVGDITFTRAAGGSSSVQDDKIRPCFLVYVTITASTPTGPLEASYAPDREYDPDASKGQPGYIDPWPGYTIMDLD